MSLSTARSPTLQCAHAPRADNPSSRASRTGRIVLDFPHFPLPGTPSFLGVRLACLLVDVKWLKNGTWKRFSKRKWASFLQSCANVGRENEDWCQGFYMHVMSPYGRGKFFEEGGWGGRSGKIFFGDYDSWGFLCFYIRRLSRGSCNAEILRASRCRMIFM